MDESFYRFHNILQKASERRPLSRQEVEFLLDITNQDQINNLFETACALRDRYFEKKIFLYGFVYFSTWCRNDCTFCFYRKSNSQSYRYRKSKGEVLDAALELAESGVHLIDLTSGEDPLLYRDDGGFGPLIDLVKEVKKQTGLMVMASPGVVTGDVLNGLSLAGADWYACYQETHNRQLFDKLRLDQSYDLRYTTKQKAMNSGLLVEEGILAGVGESTSDIALSLERMGDLGAHQVRVMSFIPQMGTPLEAKSTPSRLKELKIIAVLRLLFPERLIPASLDVDGLAGLRSRLNAGANVITSIIPPSLGFAGVAQSKRDIDEGYRTVQGVLPVLDEIGLKAATKEEYSAWVLAQREKLGYKAREAVRV